MNSFYSGPDLMSVLKKLLLKAREKNLIVSVVCDDVSAISGFLWAHSLPHFVLGDPFFEHNSIFVASLEQPADVVIVFKGAVFQDLYKCSKKYFIGKYFKELDGVYWQSVNGGWQKVSKQEFYL